MTIHEAVKAYFEPKVGELVGDILSFNFSPESRDSFALVTNYSGKIMQCMNFVQSFMEWLETQDRHKRYPVFPDNCKIEKMEVLQNMPNLAGVNTESGLARYMVQCQITYKEIESDPLGL